jgi:hypothetical protein
MRFFSRLEFEGAGLSRINGFGAGSAYPQGRQHGFAHVTKPSPTLWPSQSDGGFQSRKGAETMTTVNTPTTPKMGTLTLGSTPTLSPVSLARRLAIETALITALFHVRSSDTQQGIELATGRATRAATLLKRACSEAKVIGGAA